jgi:hypothetical protein
VGADESIPAGCSGGGGVAHVLRAERKAMKKWNSRSTISTWMVRRIQWNMGSSSSVVVDAVNDDAMAVRRCT